MKGISSVLSNISKYIKDNGDFFIVANDKLNLYPEIAKKSNLRIIHEYLRPVLARSEGDRQPYTEKIFHMRKNIKMQKKLTDYYWKEILYQSKYILD